MKVDVIKNYVILLPILNIRENLLLKFIENIMYLVHNINQIYWILGESKK
jgi:hypothetical protein